MRLYRWAWFGLAVATVLLAAYLYVRLNRYERWGANTPLVLDRWTGDLCAPFLGTCHPLGKVKSAGQTSAVPGLEGYTPAWRDSLATPEQVLRDARAALDSSRRQRRPAPKAQHLPGNPFVRDSAP